MRTDQGIALNQLSTDGILTEAYLASLRDPGLSLSGHLAIFGPYYLKPHQQLRRLLPVRLGVVSTTLRGTVRQARGMQLIERFFPREWSGISLTDEWNETLLDFLRSVQDANWFGIYWDGIEYLAEVWWNMDDYDPDDPDRESDALTDLAQFLEYIPIRYFNFGEEDWLNQVAEELPILCLIRGLVDPTYQANISSLRVEYEIWDAELPADFNPVTFRVPPDTYPPLCWLPDVVRFCAHVTGNDLLDTGVDVIWEHDWSFYRWDRPQDIEALKLLYPPALRTWERVQKFLRWCDGPEEVYQAVSLLFGGQSVERTEDDDEER